MPGWMGTGNNVTRYDYHHTAWMRCIRHRKFLFFAGWPSLRFTMRVPALVRSKDGQTGGSCRAPPRLKCASGGGDGLLGWGRSDVLTIEVAAVSGASPAVPTSARFGEAGGTIGRDPACTLVLPDPEKRISRRHALISCRAGRFSLRNQGSAIPVLLNGTPVDYGGEAALADGDRLEIGEFSLRVREPSSQEPVLPPAAATGPVAGQRDILSDFGSSAAGTTDPFADLIPPPVPAQRPAPAPGSAPQAAGGARTAVPPAIPEDFDPFAEPIPSPLPGAARPPPDQRADFSDLVPAPQEGIDELFGLKSGGPFSAGPLLAPGTASATPGPVGIDDLLRPGAPAAEEARSMPPAPAQRDDAPELSARIRLPESMPAEPVPAPPFLPVAVPPESTEEGLNTTGGMMLSWDARGKNGVFDGTRTMVIGGAPVDRRRGERRRSVSVASASAPAPATAPAAEPTATAEQVLRRALLEGLGLDPDRWPDDRALDAETARRVGKLLHSAVQGTIDLLRARATIKSEVQAHMTMIVARDNNPLKFSPNAEAALVHLLGPAQRGFMSATAAMEDAYRDLVAHQFGFTAGTRAALADVLRRFDPAKLEERLAGKSVLDTVLPAHRKAKLWDLFAERFAQISAEAEDDFQRLFGREFLRAYEEQVAKMSSLPPKEDH